MTIPNEIYKNRPGHYMQIRYGSVSGMLMKLNYTMRMLSDLNDDTHMVCIVSMRNTLNLTWGKSTNEGYPTNQYFNITLGRGMVNKVQKTYYPQLIRGSMVTQRNRVADGYTIVQIPVMEPRTEKVVWYVRENNFIDLLRAPYDPPEVMTKEATEWGILADWVEDKRDEDTDWQRKQHATYFLDSLRSYINASILTEL